jgi:cohesin complex subunit SA-1/2
LDLHVLFAAPDPHQGVALPTASVSLALDDEVQYRCAGYIQAEIERYAESLGSGPPDDEEEDGEKDSDGEETSDGEQGDEAKKAKRAKGRKAPKEGWLGFHLIHKWVENLIIVVDFQLIPLREPGWKKSTCS